MTIKHIHIFQYLPHQLGFDAIARVRVPWQDARLFKKEEEQPLSLQHFFSSVSGHKERADSWHSRGERPRLTQTLILSLQPPEHLLSNPPPCGTCHSSMSWLRQAGAARHTVLLERKFVFGKLVEKWPRWEWIKLEESEAGGGCI